MRFLFNRRKPTMVTPAEAIAGRDLPIADLLRTARGEGAQPGSQAPDFELETTGGERVRLSALRGRPVLLHFGSAT